MFVQSSKNLPDHHLFFFQDEMYRAASNNTACRCCGRTPWLAPKVRMACTISALLSLSQPYCCLLFFFGQLQPNGVVAPLVLPD